MADMELDKQTIKSLSSETRIDILKSLARRRKMPAELAKEFGMAASTISEHLKNLEDSRLIKKKETGHKWIYYELSEKGQTLVKPQYTPQFVVVLVLGGLIFLAGFSTFLVPYSIHQVPFSQISIGESPQISDITKGSAELGLLKLETKSIENKTSENISSPNSQYTIVLIALGLVMMIGSVGLLRKYRLEI